MQNPALGAMCIWKYICGYSDQSEKMSSVPLPALYLVMPLVSREEIRETVCHTTAGFFKLVDKMRVSNSIHALATIREAVPQMYALTSEALSIALAARLVAFNDAAGGFVPMQYSSTKLTTTSVEDEYMKAALRLGKWSYAVGVDRLFAIFGVET